MQSWLEKECGWFSILGKTIRILCYHLSRQMDYYAGEIADSVLCLYLNTIGNIIDKTKA